MDETSEEQLRPRPPEGYSFAEFEGEMIKGKLPIDRDRKLIRAADGLDWLRSQSGSEDLARLAEGVNRDWIFGWVLLSEHARVEDFANAAESMLVRIVGHAGRLVRAKLPRERGLLEEISALPFVAAIGATPIEAKMRSFGNELTSLRERDTTPVFVTLMIEDLNGEWRQALEKLGAVVGHYEPTLRVYSAVGSNDVLQRIARADFVMAIEPVSVVRATHDTAVPAMGVDALRSHQGSPGLFGGIGGSSVPIAVMDTGLNVNHLDISSRRSSICAANFVYWDPLVDDADLLRDAHGHGTHVTGTIAGNGSVIAAYTGMAPRVEHIRFAKVLNHHGWGNDVFILRGMDFLARTTSCPESGWSAEAVKPLIVNMSLSASSRIFEGRSVAPRKLDAVVWSSRQLYVVAQANSSIHGFSNYASAKNSLAVGAAFDSGSLAGFSSHGPTADGRLAPQIVGTGVGLHSTAGDGSRGGYRNLSGTSMASPAVAGVAALLMDAVPVHRESPALVRSRLMASAIKPDVWLADERVFPTDNSDGPGTIQTRYGLGKVSARTSILNLDRPEGWRNSSAVAELVDGEYAYQDIEVPPDTTRLDLVMTWDEPPTDTLASSVLNDLDLWLDYGADCTGEPCGEFASRSEVDNVEWIIVRNPEPGIYRAKVSAPRVYTDAPRAALAWTMIRGISTPSLEITVDREHLELDDSTSNAEISVTLNNDGYVTAGTRLHVDCRVVDGTSCTGNNWKRFQVTTVREDGIVQESEPSLAEAIPIGEIGTGESRTVKVTVMNELAGNESSAFRFYFRASAWNANSASTSVLVTLGETRDSIAEEVDVVVPSNDLFVGAMPIEGVDGRASVDLLGANVEPGEPSFITGQDSPAGSVWFTWTAPTAGMYSFVATPAVPEGATFELNHSNVSSDRVRVDIFKGTDITNLETIASANWGVQFFASSRQTYYVRLSHERRAVSIRLDWTSGQRPLNDEFIAARVIEGDSGEAEGSNAGATLDDGELFGEIAATVWFRWIASNDGMWEFSLDDSDQRLLAFTGDSLSNLRLVSGFPRNNAAFLARDGESYWLAVGSSTAYEAGREFTLTWNERDLEKDNDFFDAADEIARESTSQFVEINTESSVEPGEPPTTGIRTTWWTWTAPTHGRYAWQLEELTRQTARSNNKLMVSVFEGESLESLRLVATNGERMANEFTFSAMRDQRFFVAVGLPARDHFAFTWQYWRANANLIWGLSPDNDLRGEATYISGMAGSVSGSNTFATGSNGERSDVLGRSTLWWEFEATESGWLRFEVDGEGGPWAITVHDKTSSGADSSIALASDLWQRTENEVRFKAHAGVNYLIALGLRDAGEGGEFTLRWEEADAPKWLRYVSGTTSRIFDSTGNPVELRYLGDIAMPDIGASMYLASEAGIHVFARDERTGELEHVQLLETDFDVVHASLLWDAQRQRLVAEHCFNWRVFIPMEGTHSLQDLGELVEEDLPVGGCGHTLLITADGSTVYRIVDGRIDQLTIQESGDLQFIESVDINVVHAVLSNDGEYLYAITHNGISVLKRDLESSRLSRTDYDEATLSVPCCGPIPLAITSDDAYLFAFDQSGQQTNLFTLADRENPERLDILSKFWDAPWQSDYCRFGSPRTDEAIVDVFCPGLAFTVGWNKAAESLEGLDSISQMTGDRYNGPPLPTFDGPVDFYESPDENYLYLSTPRDGVVILSRNPPVHEPDTGPDLVISSISVSVTSLVPGESLELTASVRNEGGTDSTASTARIYRSVDATINGDDTEVSAISLAPIRTSDSITHSISLVAPREAGRYYYGACVDQIPGERDVTNNCSSSTAITVHDPVTVEPPDLVVESPTISDRNPTTGSFISLGVTVRNLGEGDSSDTTLRYLRSNNRTITLNDDIVGVESIDGISAGGFSNHSATVLAPENPGRIYYGACVDGVLNESDFENNCSDAIAINVREDLDVPDLLVLAPYVDEPSPNAGDMFTFGVTVANVGTGGASATTLRYLVSTDTVIDLGDEEIGVDSIGSLGSGDRSDQSMLITASSEAGVYYYGACVDAVESETQTIDNCSASVAVTVVGDGGGG